MADNVTKLVSVELNASQAINGIAQLNQLIQNEKDLMKQLTAENKKGSEQYAMAEKAVQELNRTKRQLQREVQSEIKLERENAGSLNQLRNQLSDLTKQYDQLSRAERENINVGGKLQKQINQVTNEIKRAEEGTQRYYRNVGNYQNAIMNAIGMNNGFARSIMSITTAEGGASGAFAAMGNSVKAFGASLMGLLTNPVFLALAGIVGAGMAFKWFYDYNEGLAEATRLTREFTGYTGDELVAMRSSIQATADVMGKDFKETLQTADTLMSHFHITGQEAMDVINKGFAAGADVNGDMLNKLKQYAPTFHDAGIAADEMMAIISQTKSGIFSEQGLEAIKQGSARIREMSDTTKKALQGIGIDADEMSRKLASGQMETFDAVKQVAGAIKELPDNAQEVGEVMSAVFGRQGKFASQEMIESLAEMSTSLDEVREKTGEYGELLLENIDTEEELDNVTAALFDMTGKGWEEMKQQVSIFAKKTLVAVVKGLIDIANWFIRLYNKSLVVRSIVSYWKAGFKSIWSAVKFVFENIVNGFKGIGRLINAVVNAFSQAGNAIASVGKGIAKVFEGIKKMSWETIQSGVSILTGGIKNAVASSLEGFKLVFTEGIKEYGESATKFGKEIGENVAEGVREAVTGHMDEIVLASFAGYAGSASGGGSSSGGGGGSSSSSGGGSKGSKGGGSKKSGSSSKSGGSSSKKGSSGSAKKTGKSQAEKDAEKEAKRLQDLSADIIAEAQKLEKKALEEQKKLSEQGIRAYYEDQERFIRDKYKALGAKLADSTTEEAKAFRALIAANKAAEQKSLEEFRAQQKANADKQAAQQLQNQIDIAEKNSKKLLDLQLQQLKNQEAAELAAVTDNEELKKSIVEKYAQKRADLQKAYSDHQLELEKKRMDDLKTLFQTTIDGLDESAKNLKERFELQMALNEMLMNEELAQYENNQAMQEAIRKKYDNMELQARREMVAKILEIEQQKYTDIGTIAGSMSQMIESFGEDGKELVALSKSLALAEVMLNQAVAISAAIAKATTSPESYTVIGMVATIAASVTAVVSAMASAWKALDSAKFATGGYIRGAGTSTSDSIPVRVSNGESIMNANTTAMFGGLLSSLNQLGGGVPIQVQQTAASVRGEDMLARAVARGVAMLPNPVVSVEDINKGQRQVEVMNERATL